MIRFPAGWISFRKSTKVQRVGRICQKITRKPAEDNNVKNASAQLAGAPKLIGWSEYANRLGFSDARKEMIRDAIAVSASMGVWGRRVGVVRVVQKLIVLQRRLNSVSQKQLDKKFIHASNFGVVTTEKNTETLAHYEFAIKTYMGSASTTQQDTYGCVKDSKVFFNSTTNNAVVLDPYGDFLTGFKLKPGTQQLDNFIKKWSSVMSLTILEFARSYVAGRLTAKIFTEAYIEIRKIERDRNVLQLDEPSLSECLSSIYCAADMYEPDESREEYEFDDDMLRSKVASLMRKIVAD